jgi:hypothetical protein
MKVKYLAYRYIASVKAHPEEDIYKHVIFYCLIPPTQVRAYMYRHASNVYVVKSVDGELTLISLAQIQDIRVSRIVAISHALLQIPMINRIKFLECSQSIKKERLMKK